MGVFYCNSFAIFNKTLNIKTIIQKNRPARSVCVLVGVGDSLGAVRLRGIPDDFVSLRLQNLLFVEPVVLISPYLTQNKNRPARSVCVLVGVGDSLGAVRLRGIPDDFVSLRLQNLLFVEPVVLISPYLTQNKNRPARSVCVLVGVGGFEPPQA